MATRLLDILLGLVVATSLSRGAAAIDISGVADVSSFTFATGFQVTDSSSGGTGTFGGVGALAFVGGTSSALMLSDASAMYHGTLAINASGRLTGITLDAASTISTSTIADPDAEGLVLLGDVAVVSLETPADVITCPLDAEKKRVDGQCSALRAADGANPFSTFADKATDNKGFEAIHTAAAGSELVFANENPLTGDGDRLVRLTAVGQSMSVAGSAPEKSVVYSLLPDGLGKTMSLVELLSVDDLGLAAGGQFVTLERNFQSGIGNVIRLYLVSTAGATDVKDCAVVDAAIDACGGPGTVYAAKELVLEWTPSSPLEGLAVDNYEGMAWVPAAAIAAAGAPAGHWLALVNDDNFSPYQIGTRFVLLRLVEVTTTTTLPPGSASAARAAVGAAALGAALSLAQA